MMPRNEIFIECMLLVIYIYIVKKTSNVPSIYFITDAIEGKLIDSLLLPDENDDDNNSDDKNDDSDNHSYDYLYKNFFFFSFENNFSLHYKNKSDIRMLRNVFSFLKKQKPLKLVSPFLI